MIDFLMCDSAIILQDIVVLCTCGSHELLNHGLGNRQVLAQNIMTLGISYQYFSKLVIGNVD